MCEFCQKHRKRKKWFLDKENYSEKMLENKNRQNVLKKLAGAGMGYYIRDSCNLMEWLDKPVIGKISHTILNKMAVLEHAGQVVNLNDAIEILKLADKHVCFECICRKMVGLESKMCCINFGPISDLTKHSNPNEKVEEIDTAEAIYRIKELAQEGFVPQVLYAAAPFPIAICACSRNYCIPLKDRFTFNIPSAFIKGHEVAVVNISKCMGCIQNCMPHCQFGAMYADREKERVVVDVTKCFGCGLCVLTCPNNAIQLEDRQTISGARNKW